MINLSLTENAPARTVPLPDVAGRALAHSGVVDASPHPDRAGCWQVRANGTIGAARISTGDDAIVVRITPKVPIARVLFLLGYRRSSRILLDDPVPVTDERELVPAVARLYAAQAEHAVQQGLMHGYREADEATHVMRGRLRHSDQLRLHHGRPLPLEVTHDEYTPDITENRLLASAAHALLRIPAELPEDVRVRLRRLQRRFAEITPLPRGCRLPAWQPTRLNARYHHALRLAELVLRGASIEHRPGDLTAHGFLVDTAKLFEDFVTIALRDALADYPGHSVLQDPCHLDEGNTISLAPDFVHYDPEGKPSTVADAKYKAERPSGYPNADVYQMLAYCVALGLPAGHLVYAAGNATHGTHRVRGAGITIHQHALELDQPPPQLLEDIGVLARRLIERS
ncbi:5-methylcytosine-specific restriction enzyme subunit McrC [Actinopolyspora alba]|uniref:5-methylcytosine-specific restriction enzyme subunit McrC n=1 Tax=Actinopolyspora alba TaxID=673379 RepID=A0A1I1YTZ3_9ACTN|nr:restriction endonuclease [Actinopolyspora alba]SFE23055.1 5-methylcytosine-specific restriction enzyme subunit McrC [Actinopolyspora alba]